MEKGRARRRKVLLGQVLSFCPLLSGWVTPALRIGFLRSRYAR
jgi:hypothetical protein